MTNISTIDDDENLIHTKTIFRRHSKGPVMFNGCSPSGDVIIIDNISATKQYDLTGWYIERTIDGHRIHYTFPMFELGPHAVVRVYGNYHRRSSSSTDDYHLQLIAPNFYDWGNGRHMRTELFNREDVGKAFFEQTIRD